MGLGHENDHEYQRPLHISNAADIEIRDAPVTAHVEDRGPEFTGLYNARGEPLYREKPTFGFKPR